MKKFLICILCVLLIIAGSACGKKEQPVNTEDRDLIVVGFSQVGAESDWRNANTQSMMEALSVENGFRLIIDDAQQKQEKQITAIRNFINQGVDYIVLAPTTEKGWETVLTEAKMAGIPVIIVDRMIEVESTNLFTCWIGSDFRKEGEKAITWMQENFKDQPLKIVHLQGNLGSSAQIGRTVLLDKGLDEHDNWTLVFRKPGDFTQAKGQELMESVLSNKIDFNVLYSENDNMTFGAIDALLKAGITPGKDVAIISFDAGNHALNLMLNGQINFDIECNPMHGPRVQAIIEQMEKGEKPVKYTYVEEETFESSFITQEIIDSRTY